MAQRYGGGHKQKALLNIKPCISNTSPLVKGQQFIVQGENKYASSAKKPSTHDHPSRDNAGAGGGSVQRGGPKNKTQRTDIFFVSPPGTLYCIHFHKLVFDGLSGDFRCALRFDWLPRHFRFSFSDAILCEQPAADW